MFAWDLPNKLHAEHWRDSLHECAWILYISAAFCSKLLLCGSWFSSVGEQATICRMAREQSAPIRVWPTTLCCMSSPLSPYFPVHLHQRCKTQSSRATILLVFEIALPCLLLITWIGCALPIRSYKVRLAGKQAGQRSLRPGVWHLHPKWSDVWFSPSKHESWLIRSKPILLASTSWFVYLDVFDSVLERCQWRKYSSQVSRERFSKTLNFKIYIVPMLKCKTSDLNISTKCV